MIKNFVFFSGKQSKRTKAKCLRNVLEDLSICINWKQKPNMCLEAFKARCPRELGAAAAVQRATRLNTDE